MVYVIQSGRYETGTPEQQMGFRQLFGEEVQYRFDLYFHWYNLIHELGHILVSQSNLKLTDIQEEMFVNEFAVSYYRYVGENPRLYDLQRILQEIIDQMPAPMPAGESFLEYYTRIWNTAELMQVMTYGYFQLNSVLEAMKKQRSLEDIAGDLEVRMNHAPTKTYKEEISSNAAEKVLQTAITNLRQLNFPVPEVRLQLMDDPSIQCARREDETK